MPHSFCRKDYNGNHIPMTKRAAEAAKYLETKQWAHEADKTDQIFRNKAVGKKWEMRTDPPDRVEVDMAIAKLKRDRAEGTDETSINMFKELSAENRKEIVEILKEWWEKEEIPKEELLARVVMI